MGVEMPHPVINDECLRLNFTNEGGVGGTIRLLKNITGLWLVQECRRVWRKAGATISWEGLLNSSRPRRRALASLVNPDDPAFQAPGDMPDAIRGYCKRTGPESSRRRRRRDSLRLGGVALKSRWVLEGLERLTGGRMETIHIVGGGARKPATLPGYGRRLPTPRCRRPGRSDSHRQLHGPSDRQRRGRLDRRGPRDRAAAVSPWKNTNRVTRWHGKRRMGSSR